MQLITSCLTRILSLSSRVGKADKLLHRFLARPKDFRYSELQALLGHFGYKVLKKGKTSGSRVAFVNEKTMHIIRLHRPHSGPNLKTYQLDLVETALREEGHI